jgi:hypothetical protein
MIKIDEDNLKSGLLGLVVALVEIIKDVLEKEAVRRMDSLQLTDDEIDRLGLSLIELDKAIDLIKIENNLTDVVRNVRGELDKLVEDSIDLVNPRSSREVRKIG